MTATDYSFAISLSNLLIVQINIQLFDNSILFIHFIFSHTQYKPTEKKSIKLHVSKDTFCKALVLSEYKFLHQ